MLSEEKITFLKKYYKEIKFGKKTYSYYRIDDNKRISLDIIKKEFDEEFNMECSGNDNKRCNISKICINKYLQDLTTRPLV